VFHYSKHIMGLILFVFQSNLKCQDNHLLTSRSKILLKTFGSTNNIPSNENTAIYLIKHQTPDTESHYCPWDLRISKGQTKLPIKLSACRHSRVIFALSQQGLLKYYPSLALILSKTCLNCKSSQAARVYWSEFSRGQKLKPVI